MDYIIDNLLKCTSNLWVGMRAVSTNALALKFLVAFAIPSGAVAIPKEIDRALLLELRIVHLQRRGYSFDLALPIQPDGDPEFFSTQHYPAGLSLALRVFHSFKGVMIFLAFLITFITVTGCVLLRRCKKCGGVEVMCQLFCGNSDV